MSTGIRDVVREKYGAAALRVSTEGSSCCGAAAALDGCCDPITSNLYSDGQTAQLPEAAVLASLGCGNPTALAELNPGRNGAGSWLGRWYRCVALGEAGRADGESLRSRHDR
jgi:arsenite methyltransferase